MNIKKKSLILGALALASAVSALSAQAESRIQCSNIATPPGFLLVEERIPASKCASGFQVKVETPRNGLAILLTPQLVNLPGKPYRATSVLGPSSAQRFVINEVVNGNLYCDLQPAPYNFMSQPAVASDGSCGIVNGLDSKRVRMYEVFTPTLEVPASGGPARVKVALNSRLNVSGYNYAVRTTASLNGGSTTVVKTGLTGNGSYRLSDLAPTLVSQANQGASFSFEIEVFSGIQSASKKTVTATGAQLIGN